MWVLLPGVETTSLLAALVRVAANQKPRRPVTRYGCKITVLQTSRHRKARRLNCGSSEQGRAVSGQFEETLYVRAFLRRLCGACGDSPRVLVRRFLARRV